MEEVAHFLIGRRFDEGAAAADGVVDARKLFAVAAVGLVAGDQCMRQAWRVLGNELQLLQARRIGLEQGVAERFR
ncbi:hypothetical protein D3C71_2174940 [compost metagenome]